MPNGEVSSSSALDEHVQTNTSKSTRQEIKTVINIGIVHSKLFTVFAGYRLALYFSGGSFMLNIKLFFLTMLGSTLVLIGASVLNDWYDTDIEPVMKKTKERPTVSGEMSLNNALFIGLTSTIIGLILLYITTVTAAMVAVLGSFTCVVLYTIWSQRRYTLNTEVGCVSGAVSSTTYWLCSY